MNSSASAPADAAEPRRTKVVVVDDSALIRKVLAEIINSQRDMTCAGAAPDPLAARELIRAVNPDVVTLDVEMPKMDGLDFLERLMRLRPMPVLMVSTLTEKGSDVTMRALELGAVDFVAKPKLDIAKGMQDYAREITDKIRAAAAAKVRARAPGAAPEQPARPLAALGPRVATTEKLIIIGASTGGTEAIKDVLVQFPHDAPGVLVTQHMPEGFTRTFAARLDKLCRIAVSEATNGERILPGHAYIAPGHSHLLVRRNGTNYVTELSQGPPVNKHRPSVDVLFRSAAKAAGANALGVILTGMGKDGAAGLLEMRQAGAWTIGEDESTCIVFGMPREAIAAGAVQEVVPLPRIAERVFARFGAGGGHGVRV